MQLNGEIVLCLRNIKTGRETRIASQKNLHMYGCADIMAQLLNGNMEFAISHMYLEYQNTNGSPSVNPTQARTVSISSYFSEITGGSPSFHDWLRVPLITNGKIQKVPDTTPNYNGNGVVFNATSGASETMLGQSPAHNYFASSGANGPSNVVAVYLVAAAGGSANPNQDVIFSGVTLSSPITLQPGHQIAVYWLQKFN